MRRTTAAVLLAAGLALAGCSSSGSGDTKPSPSASAPASSPSVDVVAACADVLVAGGSQGDPACADLSADDVFAAAQEANKRGRDALQSAIASASSADQ